MNQLSGTIQSITVEGALSLVKLDIGAVTLTAVVTDTPATANYLVEGKTIQIIFKETEVIIGKGTDLPISLRNKLVGRIFQIQTDQILARLTIETAVGTIRSIITKGAVKNLKLQTGDEVSAMIKTNEMMLSA